MRGLLVLLSLLAGLELGVEGTGTCHLYPLYPYNIVDGIEHYGDDDSFELFVRQPFNFMGESKNSFHVSVNGYISLSLKRNVGVDPGGAPTNDPVIGGYWSDHSMDVPGSKGTLTYGEVDLVAFPWVLPQAVKDIKAYGGNLVPSQIIIITWKDITFFDGDPDRTATHQLVIASGNGESYAIFNYGELDWPSVADIAFDIFLPGLLIQTGTETGNPFRLPELEDVGISQTAEMLQLTDYTNIGHPGRIVVRFDKPGLSSKGPLAKEVCSSCYLSNAGDMITNDGRQDMGLHLGTVKYLFIKSPHFVNGKKDRCKFMSRITTTGDQKIDAAAFTVEKHPANNKKYKRNWNMKPNGSIDRRGHGLARGGSKASTITTFPYYELLNGDNLVVVDKAKEGGLVIRSNLCPYAFRYNPGAETEVIVNIGQRYAGTTFGMCQNSNGDVEDDNKNCKGITANPGAIEASCSCKLGLSSSKTCNKRQIALTF